MVAPGGPLAFFLLTFVFFCLRFLLVFCSGYSVVFWCFWKAPVGQPDWSRPDPAHRSRNRNPKKQEQPKRAASGSHVVFSHLIFHTSGSGPEPDVWNIKRKKTTCSPGGGGGWWLLVALWLFRFKSCSSAFSGVPERLPWASRTGAAQPQPTGAETERREHIIKQKSRHNKLTSRKQTKRAANG